MADSRQTSGGPESDLRDLPVAMSQERNDLPIRALPVNGTPRSDNFCSRTTMTDASTQTLSPVYQIQRPADPPPRFRTNAFNHLTGFYSRPSTQTNTAHAIENANRHYTCGCLVNLGHTHSCENSPSRDLYGTPIIASTGTSTHAAMEPTPFNSTLPSAHWGDPDSPAFLPNTPTTQDSPTDYAAHAAAYFTPSDSPLPNLTPSAPHHPSPDHSPSSSSSSERPTFHPISHALNPPSTRPPGFISGPHAQQLREQGHRPVQNWSPLFGFGTDGGNDGEEVHEWSRPVREVRGLRILGGDEFCDSPRYEGSAVEYPPLFEEDRTQFHSVLDRVDRLDTPSRRRGRLPSLRNQGIEEPMFPHFEGPYSSSSSDSSPPFHPDHRIEVRQENWYPLFESSNTVNDRSNFHAYDRAASDPRSPRTIRPSEHYGRNFHPFHGGSYADAERRRAGEASRFGRDRVEERPRYEHDMDMSDRRRDMAFGRFRSRSARDEIEETTMLRREGDMMGGGLNDIWPGEETDPQPSSSENPLSDIWPGGETDPQPSHSSSSRLGLRGGADPSDTPIPADTVTPAESNRPNFENMYALHAAMHDYHERQRGYVYHPRLRDGPCIFAVSADGDIELHYLNAPEDQKIKHLGNTRWIAFKLGQSEDYVRRQILMDHRLEGRDEVELMSALRFERLSLSLSSSLPPLTVHTSFRREPRLGEPTPSQADELAYRRFVTEFSTPENGLEIRGGGCMPSSQTASPTSSNGGRFVATPTMQATDAIHGPRANFVVAEDGEITLVWLDSSIPTEFLGNVKYIVENTGMTEEKVRQRLAWAQPDIGVAKSRLMGRTLFRDRDEAFPSFEKSPWIGYPGNRAPSPKGVEFVEPAEVSEDNDGEERKPEWDEDATEVQAPEPVPHDNCKEGCKEKHQRFERCKADEKPAGGEA